jgi:hypothetical protein
MHSFKLALSLGGLLMAGQALAHKAPHTMTNALTSARTTPAQTDTNPTALLDGMSGHGMHELPLLPTTASQEAPSKTIQPTIRINRRH